MASLIITAYLTATLMLFSQLAFSLSHELTIILFFVNLVFWYFTLFFVRRRVRKEKSV